MTIHYIFEIISIIGLVIGVGFVFLVASYRPSVNQKRMVLISCATLALHVANFFSLYYSEYEALLSAYQLKTVAHICILVSFIIFIAGYCGINMPSILLYPLLVFNGICIWFTLMPDISDIFFKEILYVSDVANPYITVTPGPVYIAMRVIDFALIIALCVHLISEIKSSVEHKTMKNVFVLVATGAAVCGDFITSLNIIKGYDFTATGMAFCLIFMCVAIYKYGILDTMQVAKDNMLEAASEGLIIVDSERKLVYANTKATELLPYLEDVENTYTQQKIEEIFENEHYMIQTKDGHYEAKVSPLFENGHLKGYMAWLLDLSFINRYTREIVALKEAAEEANRSKTSFLANMSHEIRTPMNAIVGFNELILQKTRDRDIVNYASDIKLASNNLLSIINDILDLSKIESGKMEIIEKKYYMTKLIRECIVNIKEMAKVKGLEFILDIDKNLPSELYGDNDHIRNILINLMNNAVKYTNNGFVKVSISLKEINGEQAVIKFAVADSGIGIKEQDLPKLFNKFEKFDVKKNSGVEGTGLGLAIVKTYTEHLGGTITVDSEYGMGSTFTLTLPQKVTNYIKIEEQEIYDGKQTESEETDTEEKRKKFKAPNARILVTDDNNINLKVTASLLKTYGIRVDTAESGKRAIEMCRTNPYDIIFMDHMMPEMDGVEAMQRIRTLLDDDTYRSCIVALTANAISGVKQKMEEEGFDGYITKPIDINLMEETLLRLLPKELIMYIHNEEEDGHNEEITVAPAVENASVDEQSANKMVSIDRLEQKATNEDLADLAGDSFESCLAGFDIAAGIANCGGDKETYQEILQVFYESGERRISELEGFLADKDYKNYIIAVHGLKSAAASIGAMELSERAKKHEFSGKDDMYDFLHDDFDKLVSLFRAGISAIEAALMACGILNEPESKSIITEETERKAVKALCYMIETFRIDKADRIVRELVTCQLSSKVQENLDKLLKAVEIDDAVEIFAIKDILKNL